MNETLQNFKQQQEKVLNQLKGIEKFLKFGKEAGVEIDKSLEEKIKKSIDEIDHQKLRVALVGGFSEGKTSIAAAWLGQYDKESMKINREESSDAISIYQIDDEIELVDTPGLFGFKQKETEQKEIEKYKDITKKYISQSHLVLYVVNPKNPIKESHKDELHWLFRELKLLPRSVFVLSKFDEVCDLEEEGEYQSAFQIKKENIIGRLKELINLSEEESQSLSIVAVSANPFEEGIEYWLANQEEFKKLSHIEDLQNATREEIKKNGGFEKIAIEAKNVVMKEVLDKTLVSSKQSNQEITEILQRTEELDKRMGEDLREFGEKIQKARRNLLDFIKNYFSNLITQLQETSIDTFESFIVDNVGEEGILISTEIQTQFEQEIGNLDRALVQITQNCDLDFNRNSQIIGTMQEGVKWLNRSGFITSKNVLMARDGLVSVAKMVGCDLSSVLKFKPWGAIKCANGAAAVLGIVGLGLELWDSYDRYQKEEAFKEAKAKMLEQFKEGQKHLLTLLSNEEEFIRQCVPNFLEKQSQLNALQSEIQKISEQKKKLESWIKEGEEIIDVDFDER